MISKIKITMVLCLFLTLQVFANVKPLPAAVIFSDPIVVVKAKPEFTIILQANPTTGYSWSLKNYDAHVLVPVERKVVPPVNKKLMGAPGYEEWTFKVKSDGFVVPQTTTIVLIYSRPWEETGAQASSFKVVTSVN